MFPRLRSSGEPLFFIFPFKETLILHHYSEAFLISVLFSPSVVEFGYPTFFRKGLCDRELAKSKLKFWPSAMMPVDFLNPPFCLRKF